MLHNKYYMHALRADLGATGKASGASFLQRSATIDNALFVQILGIIRLVNVSNSALYWSLYLRDV